MFWAGTSTSVAVMFIFVCGWAASIEAQQTKPNQTVSDITGTATQKEAISRMLNQRVMKPAAPGKFSPQEPMTLRQFAISMRQLFGLTTEGELMHFNDLPPTDPDFSAIQALVPHLQRQAFCPGCSLNNNLYPDRPISTILESAALASVLLQRKQITLVTAEQAKQVLGVAPNLAGVAPPARRLLATAVQNKITSIQEMSKPVTTSGTTRANTAVLLDRVQRQFNISIPEDAR